MPDAVNRFANAIDGIEFLLSLCIDIKNLLQQIESFNFHYL